MVLKDADSLIGISGYDLWERNPGAGETEGHGVQPPTHALSQWSELNCI